MGRLDGKIAIVTGAGSGIGKASVELFRKEGATVVGADLHGSDFECDAGDQEQVEALVAHTIRDHGGLDIFFANAGISGGFDGIFDQDAADWAEILRVNLIGPFLAVKYAAPATEAARQGLDHRHRLRSWTAFRSRRAGLFGVQGGRHQPGQGRGDAARWRQHPCQRDLPRLIETGMTELIYERARAKGQEEQIGHLNPLKRGGAPIEIANAALFLASDEASYVNGQAIVVDGGLSASHPFNHQSYGRTTT